VDGHEDSGRVRRFKRKVGLRINDIRKTLIRWRTYSSAAAGDGSAGEGAVHLPTMARAAVKLVMGWTTTVR
jgi:hypothetical protein